MTLHLATPQDATAWLRQRVGESAAALAGGGAGLRTDSRRVQAGDVFIAWPGSATDGRRHVPAALAAGAVACLVEAEGLADVGLDVADPRIAALAGLKAATGLIAADWWQQPAAALSVVAVTATNGKSSTAWWTAQALTALGQRCGVVGTLGIGEPPPARPTQVAGGQAGALAGGQTAEQTSNQTSNPIVEQATRQAAPAGHIEFTGLTTPDPVTLQAAFRRMVDAGFAACAIEASSIGIAEHRLAGTPVAVAQFINFTQDHLDYHGSMAAYWAAKRALFSWPGLRAAVVDIDDAKGAGLAAELQAGTPQHAGLALWTCAVQRPDARLRAEAVHYNAQGLAFTLVERLADGGSATAPVHTGLIGDYNVHNLLAVLGALRALGVPLADAAAVAAGLTPVPGRMQRVPSPVLVPELAQALAAPSAAPATPLPELVVDYAHTPDALEKALAALQPMAIARGGRLWCVFGCGGNRDAGKRPLMGAIAQRLADRVLLTSDNPRNEDPGLILQQILAGIGASAEVELIEDRAGAIDRAVAQAAAADVVLIAGKGHEDYQEVAGQRRPFSDAQVAAAALARRVGAQQAQAQATAHSMANTPATTPANPPENTPAQGAAA